MASQEDSSSWSSDQLQRRLQAMDDFQFEHLVSDLWDKQGWTTEVEQQSGDAGVDVRATKTQPYPRKALIQAKRYGDKNPVGGPDIQQYSALKQQEPDVDEAIIVTTGRFTGSAEDRARDLNVKTIDGGELVDLIDSLGAYPIVESYLGTPATDSSNSSSRVEKGRDPESYIQVSPESRRALEEAVGDDLDEFLKNEQYRVMRTKERAKGKVALNPHDAKVIGVFDDMPNEDFERQFTQNKEKFVVNKEDAHMDEEGIVYIEDLTNYISHKAIKGNSEGPIIGEIKRGIQDREWMTEQGESILESREKKQWMSQKIDSILDFLDGSDNSSPEENQAASTKENSEAPVAEEMKQDAQDRKRVAEQGESIPKSRESRQWMSQKIDGIFAFLDGSDSSSAEKNQAVSTAGEAPSINKPHTNWFYGTVIGTAGWLVLFLIAGFAPPALLGPVVLISWIILPVSLVMDGRHTKIINHHRKEFFVYLLVSLVPIFALFSGAAYLYRREYSL